MQLKSATEHILSDLRDFIRQIDEKKYRQEVEPLSGSTIGQHTRHTVEIFQCLISQAETGVVNYDKRQHNPVMEEFPATALKALDEISESIRNGLADKPLLLETTLSTQQDDFSMVSSSFHREWCYALEHAIHHMAIIRIALHLIAPEVKVNANFGVGPATVKYRMRQFAK